ncbi:MAG TPA: redoxin domain-containing protein [Lutibacter sp.]|nr:redoxin domain-containing protein [Lutibacter sp.]
MNPRLSILLFLISLSLFAQKKEVVDTITVKISPTVSTRVVLYGAEGAKQKYITYADSSDGVFKLAIPKTQTEGMYRLVINQKTMDYIDFLFSNTSFEIQLDPTKLDENPNFIGSNINRNYFEASKVIAKKQQIMDSLQVVCFQEKEPSKLKRITGDYTNLFWQLTEYLNHFNKTEKSTLVKDLIRANTRIQPQKPIQNPEEYLPYIRKHYFDAVDFNNTNLIHSSILVDKVMDYVFYLTVSRDIETQNNLYKEAVLFVLEKIDNQQLKSGFIQALIQSFAKDENIVLTDYLFDNFYTKLATPFKKKDFKKTIQKELQTAVGRTASDITWVENEETIHLLELEGYDNYIIVFWSSTCPHCLKELPKLHEYTKDKKNIKVIAVGLETEESQGTWKSETYYHPTFTHVLGLQKWETPVARAYNVYSTPNFFVLNADKKIIGKPYEVVDLKVFFNGLK